MNNKKLNKNNLINILGEENEAKSFIEMGLGEKERFKSAMGSKLMSNKPLVHTRKTIAVSTIQHSTENHPSKLLSEKKPKQLEQKSFMEMSPEEKEVIKNKLGRTLMLNRPIAQTIMGNPMIQHSTDNHPSKLLSEKKPKQPEQKSFMEMSLEEKEVIKNKLGRTLMLNRPIAQTIMGNPMIQHSTDNHPSKLLSEKKPKQPEQKSFMEMSPEEKEELKNKLGRTLMLNRPIAQTIMGNPMIQHSTENNPSKLQGDQEKHNNKTNQLVPKTNVKSLTQFFEKLSSINDVCDRAKQGAELEKNKGFKNKGRKEQSLFR